MQEFYREIIKILKIIKIFQINWSYIDGVIIKNIILFKLFYNSSISLIKIPVGFLEVHTKLTFLYYIEE